MLKKIDLRIFDGDLSQVVKRPLIDFESEIPRVKEIINYVKDKRDAALRELTLKYDGIDIEEFKIDPDLIYASLRRIDPELRTALEEAREAIAAYHEHSLIKVPDLSSDESDIFTLNRPVKRAGIYSPGGLARYPSSVLMCAIPAKIAGVESIIVCSPVDKDGQIPDVTMAACALSGVNDLYCVGGAQAIAAMAYGTESIPAVDVIVGPGNKYVSIAKRLVAGDVGVPSSFAGPSEVVVIADSTCEKQWAAIDVIVQAEHGPDGLSYLISDDEVYLDEVLEIIENFVATAPRRPEIEKTLERGGYALLASSKSHAIEIANQVAPEHLELLFEGSEALLSQVESAGAVFLGPLSSAAYGDYMAGPNHVLPTYRSARFASALSANDFVRHIHAIRLKARAIEKKGALVSRLAQAEGLHAHSLAMELRRSGP